MMRFRALLGLSALLLLVQSCAYSIHDVHVSGYEPYTPQSAGSLITAHGEQFVFLGFTQTVLHEP